MKSHLHESPLVVVMPLCLLALPSVVIGFMSIEALLLNGFLAQSIYVLPGHDTLRHVSDDFHGIMQFTVHGLFGLPFLLAVSGVLISMYIYLYRIDFSEKLRRYFIHVYNILDRKYGFDDFYQSYVAGAVRSIGTMFWQVGDVGIIDNAVINSSANNVGRLAVFVRRVQTGLLYQYAFVMILGLICLLFWFVIV